MDPSFNLVTHYDALYQAAVQKIAAGRYQLDTQIRSPHDKRRGITLVARPSQEVKNRIQLFLNELKAIEPVQYYYPDSDIHITVMSIISNYEGFVLNQISVPDYVALVNQSIHTYRKFKIHFRGITASDSSVMVQGFLENSALDAIRYSLRTNFRSSTLQQSIDKRYTIQTAHATVVRFQNEFRHPVQFLQLLEDWRTHDFGTFEVDALELVYNDWYQRAELVKNLHTFKL
ncbi:2'-5' RNA ligase family protein [Pontibacter sp. CAU 1760]